MNNIITLKGRLFYIETVPCVVFTNNGKATTRRLYQINKEAKTGIIKLNNENVIINYY